MSKNDVFLCTNGDYIYQYSQEFGWDKLINSGIKQWRGIDSDDFGVDIYACAWKDYIYRSRDLGDTWGPVTTSIGRQSWTAITCDAWSDTNPKGGYIWISRDLGNTWEIASKTIGINDNGISLWSSVACSNDGNIITAVELYGGIWISIDNGVTWVNPIPTNSVFFYTNSNFIDVCMSGSGEIMSVISKPSKLDVGTAYTSDDFGETWYKFPLNTATDSNACSTDGSLIAIGASSNFIYTSNDYGFSFSQQFGSKINSWSTVTVSPDNKLFIAAAYDGYVYESATGYTWDIIKNSPENQWLDSCITNVDYILDKRIQNRNTQIQLRNSQKKPQMIGHKK